MSTKDSDCIGKKNIVVGFGEIVSVNISEKKGTIKKPVKKAVLLKDIGIENDAHSAPDDETRQISFLALESIEKQKNKLKENMIDNEKAIALYPGVFAENITTKGILVSELMLNDIIEIGGEVLLEISRIGKECPAPCSIFYKTGDCIMPREGFFARVFKGGVIYPKASINITRKIKHQVEHFSADEENEYEVLNVA